MARTRLASFIQDRQSAGWGAFYEFVKFTVIFATREAALATQSAAIETPSGAWEMTTRAGRRQEDRKKRRQGVVQGARRRQGAV